MTSPTRAMPNEAPDPVDDSTYEIISDDEAHTLSVSSVDDPGEDGIYSFEDDDSIIADGDADSEGEDRYLESSQQQIPHFAGESTVDARYNTSLDESMMTSGADTQGDEIPYRILEEVPSPTSDLSGDLSQVCGVVREWNSFSDMPDVLKQYGCPQVRLAAKLALSRNMLPICRSFRLLYVGEFSFWAKTDVNNHIGAALNATPSSSRFNIVQGSDFPGSLSSGRVQLERSGSELVVDHCAMPRIELTKDQERNVIVTMNDGSEITLRPKRSGGIHYGPTPCPDLIIIGHPAQFSSKEDDENFRFIRDRLIDEDIPTLDIALVRPYGAHAFHFRNDSLRLCVEGRAGPDTNYNLINTLPIDLYTFLALDPTQLNRHLAHLIDHSINNPSLNAWRRNIERTGKWRLGGRLRDTLCGSLFSPFSNRSVSSVKGREGTSVKEEKSGGWIAWTALIAFSAMILLHFTQFACVFPFQDCFHKAAEVASQTKLSTLSLTPPSSVSAIITSSKVVVVSSSAVFVSSDLSLRQQPEEKPSRGWLDRSSVPISRRLKFDIEVTGDHEFVVRPSEDLDMKKRKAQFKLKLHDGHGNDISHGGYWSSPDSYTVCLKDKYQETVFFGEAVVTVGRDTLSNPFEVRLGYPSMKMKIKHSLAITQVKVKGLTARLIAGFPTDVSHLKDKAVTAMYTTCYGPQQAFGASSKAAEHLKENIRRSGVVTPGRVIGSLQRTTERLHGVGRKLEEWHLRRSQATERVSKVLHDNWQNSKNGAWEHTRGLRTAPGILWARRNALQLRCQLERTLGLEDTASCRLVEDGERVGSRARL